MSQRVVHPNVPPGVLRKAPPRLPPGLAFGQLRLLEEIQEREEPPAKPLIRPEYLAGALLGLALGFAASICFFHVQANGLDAAAQSYRYTPPSMQTVSRN